MAGKKETCGTVNKVTIFTKKSGRPKGFAYAEFVEVEAVQNAVLQDGSALHDRQQKFCQHCGKGYDESAMMHHNRSVHPKWFNSKKAGKCRLCWTLFETKAETILHEREFHRV